MCLFSPRGPFIAKEDIVVYKHLDISKGRITTSYQRTPVVIGELYTSLLLHQNNYDSMEDGDEAIDWISIGLHAFVYQEEAIDEALDYGEGVARCIIPKGSTYYLGNFIGKESVVSDNLQYIELLDSHFTDEEDQRIWKAAQES